MLGHHLFPLYSPYNNDLCYRVVTTRLARMRGDVLVAQRTWEATAMIYGQMNDQAVLPAVTSPQPCRVRGVRSSKTALKLS